MPGTTNVHTCNGGMNQDLDKAYLKPDTSYEISNFRIITSEGGTTASIENVEGNRFLLDIFKEGQRIVGYGNVRDDFIVLTTNNIAEEPLGGNSMIYKVTVNVDAEVAISEVLYDDLYTVYGSTLNLSTAHQIKVVGRY